MEIQLTAENKCGFCANARCCQYVTQKIPGPRGKADFQHLLWQVSHRNVEIYKDTDGWYLLFITTCVHLEEDGGCGIYDTRPQICRDYSNDFCEFDSPPERDFKLHFPNYPSLLEYCQQRFKHWP